jgi:hypothetical protein
MVHWECTEREADTMRTNRYPGQCFTCRQRVDAEAGHIERIGGAWKVFHNGTCPAPAQQQEPARPPAPVGIYRHDGEIYLVRESRGQKNIPVPDRRRYAEKLVDATPARRTVGGDAVRYDWEYSPGVIRDLTETERVPIDDEQVNQMMIDTGQCIICHHGLWAESTIRRARETGVMVGPVCRENFAPAARSLVAA